MSKDNKESHVDLVSLNNDDIIVRNSRTEDAERIAQLARICYNPPEIAYTSENYKRQIETFPEGQICIEYQGTIIGSCSSLIVNMDDYPKYHTLVEIADNGNIQNHNPNGKHLYGIDVVVHPDYRGLKIGRQLYEARKQVCKSLQLHSVVFGGRLPNYHKYADKMPVEDYVAKVINETIYDPVMTFQLRKGFTFKYILPTYIPTDHESRYYANFMEWVNTK